MGKLLHSLSMAMVCRAVFGPAFNMDGRCQQLQDLVRPTGALVAGYSALDFFPALLRSAWDGVLDEIIAEHEQDGFIDSLRSAQREYGLSKEHVRAILIDTFFGATDSTATLMECVLAELMANPRAMYTLQAELRRSVPNGGSSHGDGGILTQDDLAGKPKPYFKAVIKECFRLHPPAPLLGPHLSMDRVRLLDGYQIPAAMPVMVNAWAIGRDPGVWGEDAHTFRPDRFLGQQAALDYKGVDFELIPFGARAGRRKCPGVNFAASVYELILGNLLYRFDWHLAEGDGVDMSQVFRLTIHRKGRLVLIPTVA